MSFAAIMVGIEYQRGAFAVTPIVRDGDGGKPSEDILPWQAVSEPRHISSFANECRSQQRV